MLEPEMHAYERDLHLILTSRPWSLYGSALMETALKPNLRPRAASTPPAMSEWHRHASSPIVDLPHNDTPDTPDVAARKIGNYDCDGDDIERGRSRAGIISRKGDKRPAGASLSSKIV
jgi:hypothetical protein